MAKTEKKKNLYFLLLIAFTNFIVNIEMFKKLLIKKHKKKIIIFSTAENLISIPLVHHVISHKKYKDYKFDIFLTKRNFIRSIKVLLVIIFYGSFLD